MPLSSLTVPSAAIAIFLFACSGASTAVTNDADAGTVTNGRTNGRTDSPAAPLSPPSPAPGAPVLEPDGGAMTCSDLTLGQKRGNYVTDKAAPLEAAGGAIVDGTYWLHEERIFQTASDPTTIPELFLGRLRIRGPRFDQVFLEDGSSGEKTVHWSGALTQSGATVEFQYTCDSDGSSATLRLDYTSQTVQTADYTGVELHFFEPTIPLSVTYRKEP